MQRALVVVDVQVDFCPGGALPVAEGDQVVEPANRLIAHFEALGRPILLTRDWHPPDHVSFRRQGGMWPVHCVQGTPGAEFHRDLLIPARARIISKSALPDVEAYSMFEHPDMGRQLRAESIGLLVVCGLATDYCVKHTVLDALREGFEVVVVPEAIRSVEVTVGDGRKALQEMTGAGARLVGLQQVLGEQY